VARIIGVGILLIIDKNEYLAHRAKKGGYRIKNNSFLSYVFRTVAP